LGGDVGYTDYFPIDAGVRQGCILSPLLYSIFIDSMARAIKAECPGAAIEPSGKSRLSLLLYADDIVLLADSLEDLQSAMNVAARHAKAWRFEFNSSKSGGVRFNLSGRTLPVSPLLLGGLRVDWVQCYRYLGVELLNSPGYSYAAYRQRMLTSASRAAGQISAMGMHSGKLTVPLGVRVYQALVRPLMEYAAEITSLYPWPAAESLQSRVAKRILQCPFRASNTAARGELGWITLEGRWQALRVGFLSKLLRMSGDRPARQVYNESISVFHSMAATHEGVVAVPAEEGWPIQRAGRAAPPAAQLWCAQLQRDLYALGLAEFWDAPERIAEDSNWALRVRKAVQTREAMCWWRAVGTRKPLLRVYSSLFDFRTDGYAPPRLQLQSYLSLPHGGWNDRTRIGRMYFTCLRASCSPLAYGLTDHDPDNLCLLCGAAGQSPDEAHLLLDCDALTDERRLLLARINGMINGAETLRSTAAAAVARNPFDFANLDRPSQLRMLLGAGRLVPRFQSVDDPATLVIMREVGKWMVRFMGQLRRIRDIDTGPNDS